MKGLEATRLLLILYSTFVDSTLSYAAAVWAPGLALAAARRPVVGGSGLSAAELQHHRCLRRLLGLPTRTPTATVLAKAGQPPLYITWLVRAARFWSSLVAAPAGSLMHTVLEGSMQLAAAHSEAPLRQLPWVAQLQRAMQAAGVQFDPTARAPLQPEAVQRAAMQHYLRRVAEAAQRPGASRLWHYFGCVRPGCLSVDGYSMAAYLSEVRERWQRQGLADLRTGVHWGAEERDRLRGPACRPRDQRECTHCAAAGQPGRVEDARHILFECILYSDLRQRHQDLFPATESPPHPSPSLSAFLDRSPCALAHFAGACRRVGREAAGLPP